MFGSSTPSPQAPGQDYRGLECGTGVDKCVSAVDVTCRPNLLFLPKLLLLPLLVLSRMPVLGGFNMLRYALLLSLPVLETWIQATSTACKGSACLVSLPSCGESASEAPISFCEDGFQLIHVSKVAYLRRSLNHTILVATTQMAPTLSASAMTPIVQA